MADVPIRIVGAAARTPLGRSLLASAAAFRGGISALASDPVLQDAADRAVTTSRAAWIADDLEPVERLVRLARPAAFQAMTSLRDAGRPRVAAFVATARPDRPGRPDDHDAMLRRALTEAIRRHADPADV